jgi:ABC-type nitrate/sulfonate/bicarbonate transport system ATPase subunit
MTAVPGRIKAVMPVGIDRPRDLQMESTHEFIELRVKIWNSIQSEVERSMGRDHDDS